MIVVNGVVPPDEDEDATEDQPFNLNTNIDRSSTASQAEDSDSITPKTPAERVRFILADEKDKDKAEDGEEDVNVDLAMHALFCQMDVLCHFEDGDCGWKESTRFVSSEHHLYLYIQRLYNKNNLDLHSYLVELKH